MAEGDKVITHPSGVNRSDAEGKVDFSLVDYELLERWARHMTDNAPAKGRNNWRRAETEEDLERFVAGAWRHFMRWVSGEQDEEDHAVALIFNVGGVELVRRKIAAAKPRREHVPESEWPIGREQCEQITKAIANTRIVHFREPTEVAFSEEAVGDRAMPTTIWGLPVVLDLRIPVGQFEIRIEEPGGWTRSKRFDFSP